MTPPAGCSTPPPRLAQACMSTNGPGIRTTPWPAPGPSSLPAAPTPRSRTTNTPTTTTATSPLKRSRAGRDLQLELRVHTGPTAEAVDLRRRHDKHDHLRLRPQQQPHLPGCHRERDDQHHDLGLPAGQLHQLGQRTARGPRRQADPSGGGPGCRPVPWWPSTTPDRTHRRPKPRLELSRALSRANTGGQAIRPPGRAAGSAGSCRSRCGGVLRRTRFDVGTCTARWSS